MERIAGASPRFNARVTGVYAGGSLHTQGARGVYGRSAIGWK